MERSLVPMRAGQRWVGSYLCAQGRTQLVLRIVDVSDLRVEAIFDFVHAASGAAGAFRMHGSYDPATRGLLLQPGAWIRRPPNYTSVPIEGRISDDATTYAGRMLHPACGGFAVRLE